MFGFVVGTFIIDDWYRSELSFTGVFVRGVTEKVFLLSI